MPRRAPLDPHGCYHVSTRGNFGQPLFESTAHHELYLDLYTRYSTEFEWTTLAWSLLWNHHHFLIQLTNGGLSEGMRAINHGFSRRMNAMYGRTGQGHLVRHCFYAGAVVSDGHFANVCRYIDLNAVAAHRCRRPQDWPWCGHAATMGHVRARRFHDVPAQLAYFGSRPSSARRAYGRLVAEAPVPGNGYEIETSAAGRSSVVESRV